MSAPGLPAGQGAAVSCSPASPAGLSTSPTSPTPRTDTRPVLIRYFASVREAMHIEHETCLSDATTLQALREGLRARGEPWASALAPHLPIRMALNHALAKPETILPEDGAIEVAFFPPVTGG